MEAVWVSKRLELWQRLAEPVKRSDSALARAVGMSRSWVQKWRLRLKDVDGEDISPFLSQSRQRKTSPRQVSEALEAKILHLREYLTERYQRRVGARNILYHLQQDADLKRLGAFIPRSQTTVHDVLVRFGRVPQPGPRVHVPREAAVPMQVWEMDFTDIVTATSSTTEKRQHQVELFDIIDTGSSVALATCVSDQADAAWTLTALVDVFQATGLPQVLRFDRDPRLVGSWTADEFPSVLIRFLLCLDVKPDVCPPRRPDLKPYVERFIRTQKEECIYPKQPATVNQAQNLLDEHRYFYNLERPNQAVTCGNRPPSLALGEVPRLPRLPQLVDPDAWLSAYHQVSFQRSVNRSGSVVIDRHHYYVGRQYAGQKAVLILDARTKQFDIWVSNQIVKTKAIQGLFHGQMTLPDYVDIMSQEACSEARRLRHKYRRSG